MVPLTGGVQQRKGRAMDGLCRGLSPPAGGSGLLEAVLAPLREEERGLLLSGDFGRQAIPRGTPCWRTGERWEQVPPEGPGLILEPRQVWGARARVWLLHAGAHPGGPMAGICMATASQASPGLACCHIQAFFKTVDLFLTMKH